MCILVADGSYCPAIPCSHGGCLTENIGLPIHTAYKLRSSITSQTCMCGFTICVLLSKGKKNGKYYKQQLAFFFPRKCPMDCQSILSATCKQNYVLFFFFLSFFLSFFVWLVRVAPSFLVTSKQPY